MNLKKLTSQLLILPVLLLALVWSGCSSANVKNYPTLKQTQTNVAWPMTRYRNALAAFVPITQEEINRVNAAYADYQAAFSVALQAAQGNYDAPTPDNVKALATEVIRVTETIPYPQGNW
jgi:hypothetical protein